jgi:hypothetical protein
MSVMLVDLRNQRAINKPGRHRMFACASALLWCLALYPVHAYSAQPKELVLTDARLFHAETPEPQGVWSDATKDGSRQILLLKMADGVTLRGWFYPSRDPEAPYVITFHGNEETIADAYSEALNGFFYASLDLNLVTFDYRGTGFSDGVISLERARADALAIYDFVAKRAAGRPIFVCGWSFGSIFASHVAGTRTSVTGLILLDPVSTADSLASHWGRPHHVTTVVPPDVAKGIQNPEELRNYRNPLLVVHGIADHAEPIAEGRVDYAAAGSTDRTFVAVPGKSHVGTIWSVEADDAIAAFIQKHLHAAPHRAGQSK